MLQPETTFVRNRSLGRESSMATTERPIVPTQSAAFRRHIRMLDISCVGRKLGGQLHPNEASNGACTTLECNRCRRCATSGQGDDGDVPTCTRVMNVLPAEHSKVRVW